MLVIDLQNFHHTVITTGNIAVPFTINTIYADLRISSRLLH